MVLLFASALAHGAAHPPAAHPSSDGQAMTTFPSQSTTLCRSVEQPSPHPWFPESPRRFADPSPTRVGALAPFRLASNASPAPPSLPVPPQPARRTRRIGKWDVATWRISD